MNKKTKALTTEQYKEILQTMKEGFCGCRPNERIATALVLEGNLGIENYCLRGGIGRTEQIFPFSERAVQKHLAKVCDYLGIEGVSTHSFRKWYATEIYNSSGCDIALVQRLLQHSSAATTQRYIGIEPQRIEQAIENHAKQI